MKIHNEKKDKDRQEKIDFIKDNFDATVEQTFHDLNIATIGIGTGDERIAKFDGVIRQAKLEKDQIVLSKTLDALSDEEIGEIKKAIDERLIEVGTKKKTDNDDDNGNGDNDDVGNFDNPFLPKLDD